MAREAPGAPFSSLASCSTISYLPASPRPRPPETTMAASSSLGPVASSTWRSRILAAPAAPRSGTGRSSTVAGATAGLLGREGLRPDEDEVRARRPVNFVRTMLRATEDRRRGDDGVPVDLDVGVVRQHRRVELDRQPGQRRRGPRRWCRAGTGRGSAATRPATAAAIATPGMASPRSPVASTLVAPWAPSSAATASPGPPTRR